MDIYLCMCMSYVHVIEMYLYMQVLVWKIMCVFLAMSSVRRFLSPLVIKHGSEMSQKMKFFSRGFSIAIFDYRRLQSILTAIVVVTRTMF